MTDGQPAAPAGSAPPAARRSILVVDDERRIRDNLATLLAAGNYDVATAADGNEARRRLSERRFDLVITDIRMESGDGFSLLEWVGANAPETLVTVITGFGSMESTIRAMRMGAFDYLVKPFDFELLAISVERAMRRIDADREREQAQAELRRWSAQLAIVNRIGNRVAQTLDEGELLDVVVRALHDEFGYHHVYIALLDEATRRVVVRAQAGAYEGRMQVGYSAELGTGITGKVVQTGKAVLRNDVREDADYLDLMPETRSQITLPIRIEGRSMGALSAESAEPDAFDRNDVTLLETLADLVAAGIKTARLFREVKETKDYLEVLVASSADAIVTTDTRGVVTFFSPGAESIYGYAAAEVLGHHVSEYYAQGAAEAERLMGLLHRHDRIKNYETVMVGRDGRKIHASISASLLKDRTGRVIGTLGVSKDLSQRVELERKLKELTITDSLTGLYNQRYFYRKVNAEMERARRQKRTLALMLFDLDRFKQFNDSFGHLAGDRMLKEVGRRVRDSIRNLVDSGFRYGGDEFVVLFPELAGEQALSVVTRIKAAIEAGLEGGVTLSVGLVDFQPEYTAEEFIRLADEAMYESKREHRGRIVTR